MSRRRPHWRAAAWVPALLWSLPLGAADAPGLEESLTRDWYRTEILVFERPGVQDFRVTEALARRDERRFPASMRSLDAAAPAEADAAAAAAGLLPAPSPFLADARTLDCLPWQPAPAPLTASDMPRLLADIAQAIARERAAEAAADADVIDATDATVLGAAAAGDSGSGADPDGTDEAPEAGDALFEPDPTLIAEPAPGLAADGAADAGADAAAEVEMDPRERLLERLARWEAEQLRQSYRWLEADALQLRPHARQLARGGAQRILFHGAWQQPVPARDAPEPILLLSGARLPADLYGPPLQRLQGTVAVTLGRFLHVAARLWLHEPAATLAPEALVRPTSGQAALAGRLRQALAPSYFELDESRRVRSEELHYLDHPRFGVLVQVLPVTPPAELQEAFDALEAPED